MTPRAVFCEVRSPTPGWLQSLTCPPWPKVADKAGIPLIVDNTSATPLPLPAEFDHGATLVVNSTTKFLTGNGTGHGRRHRRFGQVRLVGLGQVSLSALPVTSEPAYHGLKFHEALGPMAFTFHTHRVGLRDLGMTMNPQGAHYTLLGIETLSLRNGQHVANAVKVANWLEIGRTGSAR